MEKIINKLNTPVYVFVIALFAFVLRILWLHNTLFFGWEQGRDFLKLQEIASGDLVLVGPKTDIDGVFHGALSYYIPFIPFVITQGSPYLVLVTYIALHSLSIIILYKTVTLVFEKRTALIASLCYAISYSSILYNRWLSNPNLVPFFVILYLYFLVKSKNNWKFLVPLVIVWSIISHLLIVVSLSLIIPTVIYLYKVKVKINFSKIVLLFLITLSCFLSYIVFELKNDFIMLNSFLIDERSSGNFLVSNLSFVDVFNSEVVDTIMPQFPRFSYFVFLLILFYALKNSSKVKNFTFVLWFLFSVPILFFFISNAPLRHFMISVPVYLAIVYAVVINQLMKDNKITAIVLLVLILLGNLLTIFERLPQTQQNFIHHSQRTYLGDMQSIIDYIYTDSKGNQFTYDYYSVPYWKEDNWVYLFQWYGKQKYGYAPPVDRTNQDRSEIFYTIIEPNESSPVHLDNWYGEYKKDSELIEEFESGKLKVEKRKGKKL